MHDLVLFFFIVDLINAHQNATGNYLALGLVVLIGLGIALSIIFLLVLLGLLVERYRRKRDGYVRAPQTIPQDKFTNMDRVPPEHLFGSMNPNTRLVL